MKDYINLIPGGAEKRAGITKENLIIAVILIMVVIFGFLYGIKYYEVRSLAKEKTQLSHKRDNINKELAAMISEINNLTASGTVLKHSSGEPLNLKGLLEERIIWSSILREISFLVSPDLWLNLIESRKKKDDEKKEIHFAGNALSHADVTFFIAALEKSDSFTDINLNFAQQSDLSGQTVISFDVTADLKRLL